MATPAAMQFEAVLMDEFPGIRFGRVNCRKISGSSLWSQHSWNNARDLYPPLGEPNDWLDQVWDFIDVNREGLNLRVTLWRVTNHYNHIHVDFWPRGWATPPCAGGAERYKYPDGTVKYGPPELINEYEDNMANQVTSNPGFQPAFDQALEVGMYSEYTNVDDIVTTEKLAVFLDRIGLMDNILERIEQLEAN